MNKDEIAGLQALLAGWSDSEFATAASGEFCEDLKSRIEGALASQADALTTLSARVETLEEGLNAIIDRGPERDIKWSGMSAKDIALQALGGNNG